MREYVYVDVCVRCKNTATLAYIRFMLCDGGREMIKDLQPGSTGFITNLKACIPKQDRTDLYPVLSSGNTTIISVAQQSIHTESALDISNMNSISLISNLRKFSQTIMKQKDISIDTPNVSFRQEFSLICTVLKYYETKLINTNNSNVEILLTDCSGMLLLLRFDTPTQVFQIFRKSWLNGNESIIIMLLEVVQIDYQNDIISATLGDRSHIRSIVIILGRWGL